MSSGTNMSFEAEGLYVSESERQLVVNRSHLDWQRLQCLFAYYWCRARRGPHVVR